MSELTEIILKVMAGQSPDYFIYPNAAAFAAQQLDPELVAEELAELEKAGEIEREQIVVESYPANQGTNGKAKTVTVGGGYRLKNDA